MFRFASACFALGFALFAQTDAATAGGGFSGPKVSGSKGGFAPVASFHRRSGDRPFHRFHRRWRPMAPLYLDRRYSAPTLVQVNQVVAPAAALPTAYAVPSFAELPVSTGIREARPAEPAVYVLNQNLRRESNLREREGRRSPGPRIITLSDDGSDEAGAASGPFGAKIIHLTVPVGPRG